MATVTVYRLQDLPLQAAELSEEIFSPDHPVEEVRLKRGLPARLFISRSEAKVPEWVSYLEQVTTAPLPVAAREASGAVLLVKPDGRRREGYALTWGTGHFLLRSDRIEADVGLRAALNLLAARSPGDAEWNPERVRAIRTKRVGQTTLISQTQASRKSSIDVFPFSASADQLRQVTGTPAAADYWGATITGGVSLHVRRPERASGLVELCKEIENVYRSDAYKRYYGWVDNVVAVNDRALLEGAVAEVIQRLKIGDTSTVSLSPPTLVNWERAAKFEYRRGRQTGENLDPSVETFLRFAEEHDLLDSLSFDELAAKIKLRALDDEGAETESWPLLKCLTAELTLDGKSYILDEGALFAVDNDFLADLNGFVAGIPVSDLALPPTEAGENEGPYNERLAETLRDALLFDKRTVRRPQATAIEICDVVLGGRKLIHVKKGLSSSSLSHLFAQGVVSAELLYMDDAFRIGVRELLEGELDGTGAGDRAAFSWLHESPFSPQRCEIAYVVMTEARATSEPRGLPFFSKVNLRQRCQELLRMGYKYSLVLVPAA